MKKTLYYENNYLTEFKAKVTECIEENGKYKVVLDDTAFYPEGGGQRADIGWINDAHVTDVQENKDTIYHYVDKKFEVGEEVTGKIDFESRFSNMQHHTAEHIVSGLVCKKYKADNVGFHMGSEFVTMDFNVALNKAQIEEIELLANEAVWKNIEVKVTYYTKEQVKDLEYRSKKELDGIIRIVEIPGFDICACCGIHVARTGEIGAIKLLSVQKHKEGCRVTLLCGKKAIMNYNDIYTQVDEATTLLSIKHNELIDNVKELIDKNTELRHQNTELKMKIFEQEIMGKNIEENQFLIKDNLDAGEVKMLCNKLQEKSLNIAGVFTKNNNENIYRFQIISNKTDLKPISQELRNKYNVKGGRK